ARVRFVVTPPRGSRSRLRPLDKTGTQSIRDGPFHKAATSISVLDRRPLTIYKNRQSSFSARGPPPMNVQVQTKADDTRAGIMDPAEALFRRIGYAKTAVADIASELGMSPANIYRFFPSKNAIVEAICRRCLSTVEDKAWSVARSKLTAAQR